MVILTFFITKKIKSILINYCKNAVKVGHGGTLDPFAEGVLGFLIFKKKNLI